jgi:hypothetical protein
MHILCAYCNAHAVLFLLSPSHLFVLLVQEWGDPRKEEYYYYMKSYSPVDNVSADISVFLHKFAKLGLPSRKIHFGSGVDAPVG